METKTNQRFMQCRCGICGGTDVADTALSELVFKAGYGSKYDDQEMRLTLCGKCIDQIMEATEKN